MKRILEHLTFSDLLAHKEATIRSKELPPEERTGPFRRLNHDVYLAELIAEIDRRMPEDRP